jgi:Uma2 family endonuclease
MSDLIIKKQVAIVPSGEIVAENVSREDFYAQYTSEEERYEWVEGYVIKMGRSTVIHMLLLTYLEMLFLAYLDWNPMGSIFRDAITIRQLHAMRMPDLFFVGATNSGVLSTTEFLGVPELCIEIISQDSMARDYVDKLAEYEAMGVQEYWIIDPIRQKATFNRLQANGLYAHIAPNADGDYETPLFPKLKFHVATLWQDKLPGYRAVGEAVKAMFEA